MNKLRIVLLSFLFITSAVFAQENRWLLIYEGTVSKLFIDTTTIDTFKGDEIYVWVLQENDPPFIIESVPGKIYKTKTYYLFNKRIKKYAMLSIIYYDKKGNVLGSFDYSTKSVIEDYKYNFPVLPDSDEEKILNACIAIRRTK